MEIQIHYFSSTKEAYDRSQTGYYRMDDLYNDLIQVEDGDILIVRSENVYGIMVGAWPTAVGREAGAFHYFPVQGIWKEYEGGKYYESYLKVQSLMNKKEYDG